MIVDDLVDFINKEFEGFKDVSFDFRKIEKSEYYGFFPYRNGFLSEEINQTLSQGILILGQDFGTVAYLNEVIKDKGELGLHTCRNLIRILPHELKNQVFLSNVFVGLRDKSSKMTGMNELYKNNNSDYIKHCKAFVLKQIELLQPKLIIALGHYPYKFLKKEILEEKFLWKGYNSYRKEIDKSDCVIKIGNLQTKLLCIPHPSFFFPNEKRSGFDRDFVKGKMNELYPILTDTLTPSPLERAGVRLYEN